MKLNWKYKFPKIESIVPSSRRPETHAMEPVSDVEWLKLDGDLWGEVAEHLGLQALTLRRTCKPFRQSLATLPRATKLAYRLIRNGSSRHTTDDADDDEVVILPRPTRHNDLVNDLARLPYVELFKVLDVLDEEYVQLRRWECFGYQLIERCFELSAVLSMRGMDVHKCSLDDNEGHVLTERQLVGVMLRLLSLGEFRPNTIIVLDSGPRGTGYLKDWTSTWHIAAGKGMLEVLRFLKNDCRGLQPLHTRTPGGNNAYAHAARAIARILADPDVPEADKSREAIKYNKVLDYLVSIGLDTRLWRDEIDYDVTGDTDDDDDDDEASEVSDVHFADFDEYDEHDSTDQEEADSEGSGTFQVWDGDGYPV